MKSPDHFSLQELPEARAAAQRHPHPAAQLRRLPQAAELAVVETLHQSQAAITGKIIEQFSFLCFELKPINC